jgi:hypothetical protein
LAGGLFDEASLPNRPDATPREGHHHEKPADFFPAIGPAAMHARPAALLTLLVEPLSNPTGQPASDRTIAPACLLWPQLRVS